MSPITNKVQMYELYNMGMFGNSSATFPSIEKCRAFLQTHPNHTAVIRSRTSGGRCVAGVSLENIDRVLQEYGDPPASLQYSLQLPDDRLKLQGNFFNLSGEYWLEYSDVPGLTMREAMKNPKAIRGLKSYWLVRSLLDALSWEQFDYLLGAYPDHVIEFSNYAVAVGEEMANTVFWEVRKY